MPVSPDAVVVGSGPNGLAAAVTLAAAGLRVHVIEGASAVGGGCRTQELTLPGFRHDVCSAAHPLALASPFFQRFDLAARGVAFARPQVEFANPLDGGRAAIVSGSVAGTASRLGADGRAYRRLMDPLARHVQDICGTLLAPLRRPPAHPVVMAGYGLRGMLPASVIIRRWRGPEARALLAGAAAHSTLPLDAVPTGGIGLMLVLLAHGVGWPVVTGGSARITDAMADAVTAAGGSIETGRWVRSLAELPSASAVLLDVSPRSLMELAGDRLPAWCRAMLRRYRYGPGVCKVDFALSGPVPWANEDCRRAGTLHLGGTYEEIAAAEAEVTAGKHPRKPYVLVVQPGVADPSRAPAGRDTLWTYTHVPCGSDVDMAGLIEAQIERFAPGFRDLVLARSVRTAADQEAHNPNYVGGDIAVGRQTMWQTVFRPTVSWNPYRTPIRGLYLCSSATPPAPGVHGRCGELAALTALRDVFGIREPPDISPAGLRPTAPDRGAAAGRPPHAPPDARGYAPPDHRGYLLPVYGKQRSTIPQGHPQSASAVTPAAPRATRPGRGVKGRAGYLSEPLIDPLTVTPAGCSGVDRYATQCSPRSPAGQVVASGMMLVQLYIDLEYAIPT